MTRISIPEDIDSRPGWAAALVRDRVKLGYSQAEAAISMMLTERTIVALEAGTTVQDGPGGRRYRRWLDHRLERLPDGSLTGMGWGDPMDFGDPSKLRPVPPALDPLEENVGKKRAAEIRQKRAEAGARQAEQELDRGMKEQVLRHPTTEILDHLIKAGRLVAQPDGSYTVRNETSFGIEETGDAPAE